MTNGIQTIFDKATHTYDQSRKRLVPCFDALYGTALRIIPYDTNAKIDVLDLGASKAELSMALERMKADKTATLVDQLAWLQEVGFIRVDCWYKNYRFVVYSGIKP